MFETLMKAVKLLEYSRYVQPTRMESQAEADRRGLLMCKEAEDLVGPELAQQIHNFLSHGRDGHASVAHMMIMDLQEPLSN